MMFQIFSRASKKSGRMLEIGLVTQYADVGAQLKEFVAEQQAVDLRLIESKSVGPGFLANGLSVLVYDLDLSNGASMKEFERFMLQRPSEIPVIVLAAAVDDELVRWFLRLKVSDWIKTPLSPGELIAACGRVISESSSGRQDVKCLAFIGARGGVGTTTLAIHAGLAMAAKTAPAVTTCLVDLDLISGACAEYLDLKPGWQLDELIEDPGRLDDHMLDIMTATHRSGIAVLSAQRHYGERFTFSQEVITRTLDAASQRYRSVVIDLPRHAESWTDSVLLGSSDVYVVTDFSVPGLRSARRLIQDIAVQTGGDVKPKAIVNKHSRALFGSGLSSNEAKELLRDRLAGYVSADERLAREAIDRGVPTTEIKARNSIMSDLSKILGL